MPAAEPRHDLTDIGPQGEAEWQRLRRQLDMEPGFWVGFVFCSSPRLVTTLRHRAASLLAHRTRRLRYFNPATPQELRNLLPLLVDAQSAQADALWIDALHVDGATSAEQDGPWAAAWDWLMMRTNEHREVLQRRLGGGLVFAAHRTWKPRVRHAAPDLWSIRTLVIDLEDVPVDVPETSLERRRGDGGGVDADAALAVLVKQESNPHRGDTTLALFRAATALQAAGRTVEARQRVDELAEKLGVNQNNPRLKAQVALLDGRVAAAEGDIARAKDSIDQAIKRFRALCQDSDIPLGQRDLAGALIESADIEDAIGGAPQALDEALAIRRRLVETLGETPEMLRDLSVVLEKVGDLHLRRGDEAGAGDAFDELLAIDRRLVDMVGETPETLRDLCITLGKVGDLQGRRGDDVAAMAAFEEVRRIHQQLDAARAIKLVDHSAIHR